MTAPYTGGYGGIARAPDGGAELGGALSQLGGAIGGIIDPDYKLQKSMQAAIASNPELGQSLADRAYVSGEPDYLEKLGLGGKLSQQIRATPPSPDAHTQLMMKHFLGQDGMDDVNKMHEALKQTPPEFQAMARKAMHMPSDDELAQQTAKTSEMGSTATIDQNNAATSNLMQPLTQEDIQDHINYLKNPLNPQQAQQIAQSMASGGGPLPPQALSAMKYDPNGVGKFITDQIAALKANKETSMEGKRLSIETTNQALQYAAKQQTHLDTAYGNMAPVYDKVNNVLADIQKGGDIGKAAMSSLPLAIGALDAVKPRGTALMYQYLKSTSPKWTDTFIRKFEAGTAGTLPKDQLNGLIQYFKGQSDDITGSYKREYDAIGKRFPEAQQYVTAPSDKFNSYNSLQPQGATPAQANIPPDIAQKLKGGLSSGKITMSDIKSSQAYKQYGDPLIKAIQ